MLLISIPSLAQTAKVIELSPEDAALAKRLHENQIEIERQMKEFQRHVRITYLLEHNAHSGSAGFGNGHCVVKEGEIIPGWFCGDFDLSDDFRFIVPTPMTTFTPQPNCSTFTVTDPAGAKY